ncbi:MAG: multiheme c-type cytochrome [Thermoanaerobaculia bacterium]|nr:multiheme c-type cytochrome [Thermoanaerobaculia bacterium]
MPRAAAIATLAALLAAAPGTTQEIPFAEHARQDPAKIVTAERCGECHTSEVEVWEKTGHATGFKTLHRKEQAAQIAGKLGFRLIKRQSFCFRCHYTAVVDDDSLKVVSGVSCESCHGAGRDWIEVHSDYGAGNDFATEPAAHRQARIARSRELGMRRPSDLYPVVANCFSCHTVPYEELVNVGGHTTGTADFEFVKLSQGEIRHNFLDSTRRDLPPANAERPPERKRVMYVMGRALDLEYSLRAAAEATAQGLYAKAHSRRVRAAVAELKAIERATSSIPEVGRMLAAVKEARVVPGNRDALLAAAERVGEATRSFLARADGTRLASVDPLLEGIAPVGEEEEDAVIAAAPPGADPAAPSDPAPQRTAPATPAVEGAVRSRIRPANRFATLGPGACSNCHAPQNEWWFNDPHYRAADPFFDGAGKNLQIARLYGISPAEVTRGDRLCMDCHGTVVTGKERREVLDGVGCEACHGAASEWLEPHKEGEGRDRPGFARALELGKRDPRELEPRATMCAGCHYVTDPRLLSSGHPSGADFDYLEGMREIRHWESEPAPAAQLAASFRAALETRGAVPSVRVARLTEDGPGAGAPAGGGAATVSTSLARVAAEARARTSSDPASAPPLIPAPRPRSGPVVDAAAERDAVALGLPELPAADGSEPIEDVLLALRDRLRRLYDLTGRGGGR